MSTENLGRRRAPCGQGEEEECPGGGMLACGGAGSAKGFTGVRSKWSRSLPREARFTLKRGTVRQEPSRTLEPKEEIFGFFPKRLCVKLEGLVLISS